MSAAASAPVLVHRDTDELAGATAARLVARLAQAQSLRGSASVVLTGGRNGNALLAALATAEGRDAVDFSRLDVWWGDERFLPEGDPERNVTQAREAVLDALPLDAARVHPMAPSDGTYGDDASAAAKAYAAELAAAGAEEAGAEQARPEGARAEEAGAGAVPAFDVLLLGVGPDTHVASLFPGHPAVAETERHVVAVHNAPKPPPVRISLTLPAIRTAREVWLLAAGEDKADAVSRALSGQFGPEEAPACGAYGTERTLWLLDEAAAKLP
ncbi:6-phosphogluconolactonase [Streptomyces nanshensis]|uniref:6-phosphogluconolactonase n=1 Tax=Streptomyces nanshensis TaxID=518642 RepID=A0A1E7LBE5_9ACTN|nr:6-phosphogluconolactonase [Streptomyces nanshensis]OEV13470.1 6-phosphogluconolactonase [Streptomyces nanshensis]